MKWKLVLAISVADKFIGWVGYFGTPDDVKTAWRLFVWLSVENVIIAWIALNGVLVLIAWYYVLISWNPPWLARIPIIRNAVREDDAYPLKDDLIELSKTVCSHAQNLDGTWETRFGAPFDMERQTLIRGFQRHQIPHPDAGAGRSEWYYFCVLLYPDAERGDIDSCRKAYNNLKRRGESH